MTTPRIGDMVHYASIAAATHPECRAAIITGYDDTFTKLHVLHPNGKTSSATTYYDTHGAHVDADGDTRPTGAGFTPGTWHHIH